MREIPCASSVLALMMTITSTRLPSKQPQWKSYSDDITGRELNRDMVEAARVEELAVIKKMQVWRKVRRE